MASPRLLLGRHSESGAWYVVTTVLAERRRLFTDPRLAAIVTGELTAVDTQGTASAAWVLMPDHLHWLFALEQSARLSKVVQRLKSRSAIAINRLRGTQGAVWQHGYYDHRLRDDEDLKVQARYLLDNPVRAGLVERIGVYPHAWCRWQVADGELL
jgi:REP element-mobilizing transposase RayT